MADSNGSSHKLMFLISKIWRVHRFGFDCFKKSDSILEIKKVEEFVRTTFMLKVISASPAAYSANPKSQLCGFSFRFSLRFSWYQSSAMTNVHEFSIDPSSAKKKNEKLSLASSSMSSRGVLSTSLQAISPKLVKNSYWFWSSQVYSTVGAHELEEHLLRLDLCPPPFIHLKHDSNPIDRHVENSLISRKIPNPDYIVWKRIDKALVSWLLESISESMFGHIARCQSASNIWCTLENEFQSESKAK